MTRDKAIEAYRRTKELEHRARHRLNSTILWPHFGDLCRMHNCQVNYNAGFCEGNDHAEKVKLAKLYEYQLGKLREVTNRLEQHFATFF